MIFKLLLQVVGNDTCNKSITRIESNQNHEIMQQAQSVIYMKRFGELTPVTQQSFHNFTFFDVNIIFIMNQRLTLSSTVIVCASL